MCRGGDGGGGMCRSGDGAGDMYHGGDGGRMFQFSTRRITESLCMFLECLKNNF